MRQDPFHPALWLLLGEGHRLAGDGRQAEQAYRRAAELAPDDVAPWVALGHLALERGRLGTAVEAVGAARRIQPDSLEVAQLQAAVNRAVALDDAS